MKTSEWALTAAIGTAAAVGGLAISAYTMHDAGEARAKDILEMEQRNASAPKALSGSEGIHTQGGNQTQPKLKIKPHKVKGYAQAASNKFSATSAAGTNAATGTLTSDLSVRMNEADVKAQALKDDASKESEKKEKKTEDTIPEEEPETSTSHQSQDAVAVSDDTGMGHIFNSDLRLLKAGGVASASSTSKDVAAESGPADSVVEFTPVAGHTVGAVGPGAAGTSEISIPRRTLTSVNTDGVEAVFYQWM